MKKALLSLAFGVLSTLNMSPAAAATNDGTIDIPSFWIPSQGWLQGKWTRDLWQNYHPDGWLPFASSDGLQQQGLALQNAFAALAQLPTPAVSIVLPTTPDVGTTYAAAAAADSGANLLAGAERGVTYLSSHLSLSAGLSGAVGLTSTPFVGVLAGIGNSLGIGVNLSDFISQSFNSLRTSFWQVGIRPAEEVIVPSPIAFVLGNPDQNAVMARLNPGLPVRFDKQGTSWVIVGPQGSYTGHVGVIELYTQNPLDQLRLDGLSQGMAAPINLIIAGTDPQGTLAAARLFHPADMSRSEQVQTLLNLLKTSLTLALPVKDHLAHWTQINNSSAKWGQGLGIAVRDRVDLLDPMIAPDLTLGATIVVTADDQGLPSAIYFIRH